MLKENYIENINESLKNHKGEYEFWFHPNMGCTTTESLPLEHGLRSFNDTDPVKIVEKIEEFYKFREVQYRDELKSFSDKFLRAKYFLALLYWEAKIATYVHFRWNLPNNAFPFMGFKGRCSKSALRDFALAHRTETPFLDLHRHGIKKFLKNFQFYFAGLLGLNPSYHFGNNFDDDHFLLFLMDAKVISAFLPGNDCRT